MESFYARAYFRRFRNKNSVVVELPELTPSTPWSLGVDEKDWLRQGRKCQQKNCHILLRQRENAKEYVVRDRKSTNPADEEND